MNEEIQQLGSGQQQVSGQRRLSTVYEFTGIQPVYRYGFPWYPSVAHLPEDFRKEAVIYDGCILLGGGKSEYADCSQWIPESNKTPTLDLLIYHRNWLQGLTLSQRAALGARLLPIFKWERRQKDIARVLPSETDKYGNSMAYTIFAATLEISYTSIKRAARILSAYPKLFTDIESGNSSLRSVHDSIKKTRIQLRLPQDCCVSEEPSPLKARILSAVSNMTGTAAGMDLVAEALVAETPILFTPLEKKQISARILYIVRELRKFNRRLNGKDRQNDKSI